MVAKSDGVAPRPPDQQGRGELQQDLEGDLLCDRGPHGAGFHQRKAALRFGGCVGDSQERGALGQTTKLTSSGSSKAPQTALGPHASTHLAKEQQVGSDQRQQQRDVLGLLPLRCRGRRREQRRRWRVEHDHAVTAGSRCCLHQRALAGVVVPSDTLHPVCRARRARDSPDSSGVNAAFYSTGVRYKTTCGTRAISIGSNVLYIHGYPRRASAKGSLTPQIAGGQRM